MHLTGQTSRGNFYCYYTAAGFENDELFVDDHVIGYVAEGAIEFVMAQESRIFRQGETFFLKKGALLNYRALAINNAAGTKIISFRVTKSFLQELNSEIKYAARLPPAAKEMESVIALGNSILFKSFFLTMTPYFEYQGDISASLMDLKAAELVTLALTNAERLKNVLFDFQSYEEARLGEVMNKYFFLNIPLREFARLTNRSEASFKRDFRKAFNTTPHKWLKKKRLDAAYHLIVNRKLKPSDVYLKVGFESLPHFSMSFREAFGCNPSEAAKHH